MYILLRNVQRVVDMCGWIRKRGPYMSGVCGVTVNKTEFHILQM